MKFTETKLPMMKIPAFICAVTAIICPILLPQDAFTDSFTEDLMDFGSSSGPSSGTDDLSSPWVVDKYTRSRLFVGGVDIENNTVHLGWQISLKDGWKTYWRSPGDAGLPPRWTWTKADNVQSITVSWPAPELLHIFDMDTYVYSQEVVLPIDMVMADGTKPASVMLDLDYMICAEMCIPKKGRYQLDLSQLKDMAISPFQKAQLDRHRSRVPIKISGETTSVRLDAQDSHRLLIDLPETSGDSDMIIVEGPGGMLFGRANLINSKDKSRFMVRYSGAQLTTGQPLTLTLLSKIGTASEMTVAVTDAAKGIGGQK